MKRTYSLNVPSGEFSISSTKPDFIVYDAYEILLSFCDKNDIEYLRNIEFDDQIKITIEK
jgi:hypothetical protein